MLLPQMPLASEAEPPVHKSTGNAADDFALKASLQTRLAYVITGDADIDRTSEEGLSGLSKVLRARTALEPAEPMGIDIDKDELAFFPVLYWPVREDVQPLSDATLAKVDAFMKQGGLIIFDTRDQGVSAVDTGAQSKALKPADRSARHTAARAGARKSCAHQVVLPDAELPRPLRRRLAVGRGRA